MPRCIPWAPARLPSRAAREQQMGISGHSGEIPFINLLQVKAVAGTTCRFRLEGPQGEGVLFIEAGQFVHAAYGSLRGKEAVMTVLEEEHLYYLVKADVPIPERTMAVPVNALLLEAADAMAASSDAATTSASPRAATGGVLAGVAQPVATPGAEPAPAPDAPAPDDAAAASPGESAVFAPATQSPRAFVVAAGALALAAIGFVVWIGMSRAAGPAEGSPISEAGAEHQPLPSRAQHEAARSQAIEVTRLAEPQDRLPRLVAGHPPTVPVADAPYIPTVTCRLLLTARGAVAEASIYQPREGIEAFEEAALEAVKSFRFQPALRRGEPVAVWVNWPVDFIP